MSAASKMIFFSFDDLFFHFIHRMLLIGFRVCWWFLDVRRASGEVQVSPLREWCGSIGFEGLYSRSPAITVTISFSQSFRSVQLNGCSAKSAVTFNFASN